MSQSPLSGKSTSTKTILTGAFGCLLAVFIIATMIVLGIGGYRLLSGGRIDVSALKDHSSDDGTIEEEGSALELLGAEGVDSGDSGEDGPSVEAQDPKSEFAGVILRISEEIDGGYANIEWKNFLHIEAGSGYSPAQAETTSVYFDLVLDIGEGIFSGSAEGSLSGQELLHKENGQFAVANISGTITENPQRSGFVLEGIGDLNCQIDMVENYTDGAGKQYTYQRDDSFSDQIYITGKLMLLNNIWELNLMGVLDNSTQSFLLSCRDCPVGTWEP